MKCEILELGLEVTNSNIINLVKSASFDYINPDVVTNFKNKNGGIELSQYFLIHFGKALYTHEIQDYVKKHDLKFAGINALLTLAILHPALQREFPVIALGDTWESKPNYTLVPALWGGKHSRELNLCSLSIKWVGEDRFLVYKIIG